MSLAPPRDPNHRCPALLAGVLRPKAGSCCEILEVEARSLAQTRRGSAPMATAAQDEVRFVCFDLVSIAQKTEAGGRVEPSLYGQRHA